MNRRDGELEAQLADKIEEVIKFMDVNFQADELRTLALTVESLVISRIRVIKG